VLKVKGKSTTRQTTGGEGSGKCAASDCRLCTQKLLLNAAWQGSGSIKEARGCVQLNTESVPGLISASDVEGDKQSHLSIGGIGPVWASLSCYGGECEDVSVRHCVNRHPMLAMSAASSGG
jgi:hypothetical protein